MSLTGSDRLFQTTGSSFKTLLHIVLTAAEIYKFTSIPISKLKLHYGLWRKLLKNQGKETFDQVTSLHQST